MLAVSIAADCSSSPQSVAVPDRLAQQQVGQRQAGAVLEDQEEMPGRAGRRGSSAQAATSSSGGPSSSAASARSTSSTSLTVSRTGRPSHFDRRLRRVLGPALEDRGEPASGGLSAGSVPRGSSLARRPGADGSADGPARRLGRPCSIRASMSRISETRPSPRMLAPERPGTGRKFRSSDFRTTSCMPSSSSTTRPMVASPFVTTTTVRRPSADGSPPAAGCGRRPAEQVAERDQRDDPAADLDRRPALDPVDLRRARPRRSRRCGRAGSRRPRRRSATSRPGMIASVSGRRIDEGRPLAGLGADVDGRR